MNKLEFELIKYNAWKKGITMTKGSQEVEMVAVCNVRFAKQVEIQKITLNPLKISLTDEYDFVYPEHILIQNYSAEKNEWYDYNEYEFEKPSIIGSPLEIDLGGLSTGLLRMVCDNKHPIKQLLSDFYGNLKTIQDTIFDNAEFIGNVIDERHDEIPYYGMLKKGKINPLPCNENQSIVNKPHMVSYKSDYFAISFSLKRPMIMHMSWDDLGKGCVKANLMPEDTVFKFSLEAQFNSYSGPTLNDVLYEIPARLWGGEVEVDGNKVIYKNVRIIDSYSLDVIFTINEKGMEVDLKKTVKNDVFAIDMDDWRFVWDMKECMLSDMGIPDCSVGRTGIIKSNFLTNAPGRGTLAVRFDNDDLYVQTGFTSHHGIRRTGICLGNVTDKYGYVTLKKGVYNAKMTFDICPITPNLKSSVNIEDVPVGILRNWSSPYGFRAEFGGFSNNSITINCHVNQKQIGMGAPFSKTPDDMPSMIDLMKYTVELGLKGGPAYGSVSASVMDGEPSLLTSVAQIYGSTKDTSWLKSMWEYIIKVNNRMFDNMDECSILTSKTFTGNTGSRRWSSNGWDVVSMGHNDAISTLNAYRALKNMVKLSESIDDIETMEKCIFAAKNIKHNFSKYFYNEETGWFGGWRSKDGVLHDYGFTFINYMAICYELIDKEMQIKIFNNVEKYIADMGLDYYGFGIPCNLISINRQDTPYCADSLREDGLDQYGIYLNGALTNVFVAWYLDALYKLGYKNKYKQVSDDILEQYKTGDNIKGAGEGIEFYNWEGRRCGYEGTFVMMSLLSVIAGHKGLIDAPENIWWLE